MYTSEPGNHRALCWALQHTHGMCCGVHFCVLQIDFDESSPCHELNKTSQYHDFAVCCRVMQCVAVCCRVQCVAVCCSVHCRELPWYVLPSVATALVAALPHSATRTATRTAIWGSCWSTSVYWAQGSATHCNTRCNTHCNMRLLLEHICRLGTGLFPAKCWVLYVGHDSFICETCLICMWDRTHSYLGHDSFMCGT